MVYQPNPGRKVASVVNSFVRAMRPKQWPKNLLVFAAPGAAKVITQSGPFARTIGAFVAFCLVSSATYLLNDVSDVDADRRHPTKRNRPIASGAVSIRSAVVGSLLLFVGGIMVGVAAGGWRLLVVLGLYVATTTAYSLKLKHVAVVDLVLVSAGFVLRAVAGAVAVDVPLSNWFLITVSFGSMFIVTGKRYAELLAMGDDASTVRASLRQYTPNYLRMVLGASLTGSMLSYCLWAFEKENTATYRFPLYLFSVLPMVTAMLRYLLVLDQGKGAAPEEVFWHDRTLQILGVVWVVVFTAGVYAG
jgi:decaprenyl-phosphate phosphoribosyltransferase